MLPATAAYDAAIVGGKRRIIPQVVADIVDPDIVYSAVSNSGGAFYSKGEQLYNKVLETSGPAYITLEHNRWLLDGSWSVLPDDASSVLGEQGEVLSVICDEEGIFTAPYPYSQLNVSNVSILQAAAVYFSDATYNGIAVDFVLDIYSGSEVIHSIQVIGNSEAVVFWEGFTVYNVTALRVTVSKWSQPYRRVRIIEIIPGIYETWGGESIYEVDVIQETSFDCLTVPYGSCNLVAHNKNKRFNPYNKNGIYQSIENRQGIKIYYGVQLANKTVEYLPLGIFYQQNGGWETNAYGLTITFKLVDIIGLLAQRDFVMPVVVPNTLEGWIAAIVAHLGANFADRYEVATSIAATELVPFEIKNSKCGDVLRYACMASGAFFCADAATGKLRVAPLPTSGGIDIGLDNMNTYPQNSSNASVAQINVQVINALGEKHDYIVQGTMAAADMSLTVNNPFVRDTTQAQAVVNYIMRFYGGIKMQINGRGNMRSELGDIDTIATGFGDVATGRRYKQQLKISSGIMKKMPSYLLLSENFAGDSL